MTNYEKIKSMSVEELSEFFDSVYLDGYYDGEHECIYAPVCDKEWLESEVSDND